MFKAKQHLLIVLACKYYKKSSANRNLPPTVFPYWATSMDMLVPRGQLNDTISVSHPAFWYVLSVPDRRAAIKNKHATYL